MYNNIFNEILQKADILQTLNVGNISIIKYNIRKILTNNFKENLAANEFLMSVANIGERLAERITKHNLHKLKTVFHRCIANI